MRAARPCITHANFLPPGGVEKIKALGIVLDLQPDWLWLDSATLRKTVRGQTHGSISALQDAVHDNGIRSWRRLRSYAEAGRNALDQSLQSIPRHVDYSYAPAALGEGPLHPEQRISREQAIRLYTINNAYLTFDSMRKGSLEAGKLADLIVLDHDILTCPVDDVRQIQVSTDLSRRKTCVREAYTKLKKERGIWRPPPSDSELYLSF